MNSGLFIGITSFIVFTFTMILSNFISSVIFFSLPILYTGIKIIILSISNAKGKKTKDISFYYIIMTIVGFGAISLSYIIFIKHYYPPLSYSAKTLYGIVLTIYNLGILLWHQSVAWLGKSFVDGVILPDKIIKNGPYLLSRNPIYLAYIIIIGTSGSVFLLQTEQTYRLASSTGFIIGVLLIYLTLSARISLEEKSLYEGIGDEYIEYQEKIPRLFFTRKSLFSYIKSPFFPHIFR